MKTALATAFATKGVTSINVEFQMALAKFQNNGGTYGVALAMLNAAYGKGSEGPKLRAGDGRVHPADASPTHDGEVGRTTFAGEAVAQVPTSPSTPTGRDKGLGRGADKASPLLTNVASRPGHAKRGAIAIASVQGVMAKSLFDRRLPDGRSYRDVSWIELPKLAREYRRESRILMAVHNHAIPPDLHAKIPEIVNEKELEAIVASVERFNEIA